MPRWNNDEKIDRDRQLADDRIAGVGWFRLADRYRVTVTQAMRIVRRERDRRSRGEY